MPNPKPLRTTELPAGLPKEQMSTTDAIKDMKGNIITECCAEIGLYCIENGKLFSIENPTRSIIWEMPQMKTLLDRPETEEIDFHACMWGGKRPKRTAFVTNSKELQSLRKTCNHQKWEHESSGVSWSTADNGWKFATEDECEYPTELCQEIARAIASEAQIKTCLPPARRKQTSKHSTKTAAERATVGKQSKRHIRPEAVPERQQAIFIYVTSTEDANTWKLNIGNLREPKTILGTKLPAGTRIHKVIEQSKSGQESGPNDQQHWLCEIHLPWSEDEFFNQATSIPHPSEAEPPIPDRTKRAIFEILASSPEQRKGKQEEKLDLIRQLAKGLAPREEAAKKQIKESVRKVNKKKQTILTAKLLRKINYGDLDVVHRLLTGSPLVGTMRQTTVFEQRSPKDIIVGADPTWLARTATAARENLREQVTQTANDETLSDIYGTTTHPETGEVANGQG
jgi:hypothetical protein